MTDWTKLDSTGRGFTPKPWLDWSYDKAGIPLLDVGHGFESEATAGDIELMRLAPNMKARIERLESALAGAATVIEKWGDSATPVFIHAILGEEWHK